MAYIRCGGGSSAGTPTFTETVIGTAVDNSTLTFTGDYHDYPLLIIRTTNLSSGRVTDLFVSPNMLDSIFSATNNEIVLNEFGNNQYGTYRQTNSTTWEKQGSINIMASEVIGLICDNYTVSETEIYDKGTYDTQSREITGINLFSYDILLIATSNDGVEPNAQIIQIPPFVGDSYDTVITAYNWYDYRRITNTTMASAPYHYVSGIKFI